MGRRLHHDAQVEPERAARDFVEFPVRYDLAIMPQAMRGGALVPVPPATA